MADINQIKLPDGDTYNIKDNTKLPLAGGTMSGQIKTSFKSSVATGSYGASASTIPDLCTELRYSSGVMGSASISTSYTKNGVTIAAGWYNFLWIPHRSGGVNGKASGDNCDYGSLYLSGMTTSGCYMLRFASGNIAELKDLYKDTTYESKSAASGGTALSLVTTGEKYNWNNKTADTLPITSGSSTNTKDYIDSGLSGKVEVISKVPTTNNMTISCASGWGVALLTITRSYDSLSGIYYLLCGVNSSNANIVDIYNGTSITKAIASGTSFTFSSSSLDTCQVRLIPLVSNWTLSFS